LLLTMSDPINVLVLCTGNSARSILGEALFTRLGAGRVQGFSAGSKPKGAPHPAALRLLARKGYDVSGFRSKSWDEFSTPGAPKIDFSITVCGNAAGEACPIFFGAPVRAHWGLPDPADEMGGEAAEDAAFAQTYDWLELRVKAFMALPLDQLAPDELRAELAAIGAMDGAA
jgi:arsenate reductase (thioredoxin)